MREIKFRFWDAKAKAYAPTDDFNIHNGKWSTFEVRKYLSHKGDDIVVEQYTGLKDKNGREIYEGDILKDKYGNIGPCYWTPSNWEFINTGGCVESGEPWIVIGNIHENPELLKGGANG